MSRLTATVGALGFTLLTSTGAFAQAPPNPNDNVPDTVPFTTPYGEPINIATAKKTAEAALAEATKRNWGAAFCVAIVAPSGDLVFFERSDNCQYASISIAQHKARVAAKYRRPTLAIERGLGNGSQFVYLTTLDDVIASRGGNLLVVGGKIIGAIGVSGGTGSQDDVVSQAGAAVLK